VPALSGWQIAELFYWNGSTHPNKRRAAREACYRDLKRLVYGDFLYRFYPPSGTTPASARRRRQEHLSLYYLGRDAIPLVELHDGHELTRNEYVMSIDQLNDHARVFRDHDGASAVSALARQARELQHAGEPLVVDGLQLQLSFQPLNWYGPRRTALSFTEPIGQTRRRIAPSGLAAIGVDIPGQVSLLAPFFYEYVSGAKPNEQVAEKLLRYAELRLSGALSERFPKFPLQWLPPILVICRDPGRVAAVQEAVAVLVARNELLRDGRAPVAIIADAPTLTQHGITGTCWMSLWETGARPERYQLAKVLAAGARPLMNELDSSALLTVEPKAATRANPGGPRQTALPAGA
jgi:hypothetical protein